MELKTEESKSTQDKISERKTIMNNSYVLTEIGQKQCETYIAELKAKRKELLDAGIDTANNTYIDFTPQELFEDMLEDSYIEDDNVISNSYGVTDHYDSDYPLCLKYGVDFLKM